MIKNRLVHLFNRNHVVRLRNATFHVHDRAGLGPEGVLAVFNLIEVNPDARLKPQRLPNFDGNCDLAFGVMVAVGIGFLSKTIIPYISGYSLHFMNTLTLW